MGEALQCSPSLDYVLFSSHSLIAFAEEFSAKCKGSSLLSNFSDSVKIE